MKAIRSQGRVQVSDWVTCRGFSLVGVVQRVARDGRWADVDWGTHTKRMQTAVLVVQTSVDMGNGWVVTDLTS
jgi:hypothetical protein